MELPLGDSHHDLTPHNLSLQVGIGIIFTAVMAIVTDRGMGGQLFQPHLIIVMQTWLVVVNKDRGGNMHGVAEQEPPPDATFSQAGLHLLGDIDHPPPGWYLKPQFLMIAFHNAPFFVCSGILINLL
jgi:hypothetical protein